MHEYNRKSSVIVPYMYTLMFDFIIYHVSLTS